jgi:hypothetical protein
MKYSLFVWDSCESINKSREKDINIWMLHLMVHKTHVRLCGGKRNLCALRNGVTQQIHVFRMPFSLFYNYWITVKIFDHISRPSSGSSQTIIGELQEHKMPKILVSIELGNPRAVRKIQIKFKNKFNQWNQEAKQSLREPLFPFAVKLPVHSRVPLANVSRLLRTDSSTFIG